MIAEFRVPRWMLIPITVAPALACVAFTVWPKHPGDARWLPWAIYVPVVALISIYCLRLRLVLTPDALYTGAFGTVRLARADLLHATRDHWGVALVAVSGETQPALDFMQLLDRRAERMRSEINAWAGTREPEPPPLPPLKHGWDHRTGA